VRYFFLNPVGHIGFTPDILFTVLPLAHEIVIGEELGFVILKET